MLTTDDALPSKWLHLTNFAGRAGGAEYTCATAVHVDLIPPIAAQPITHSLAATELPNPTTLSTKSELPEPVQPPPDRATDFPYIRRNEKDSFTDFGRTLGKHTALQMQTK